MQHVYLDKATSDKEELKSVIRKMSERLARRLRKHEQTAKIIYLGLRPEKQGSYGWGSLPHFSGFTTLCIPTDHGYTIYKEALKIFNDLEFGGVKIRLVAVGVADLGSEEAMVFDIFRSMNTKRLDKAVDEINDMYGGFTIRPGEIVYQYAKEQELS
jgi:nucleotidyltransferase/DNA polymerase involved in DNA repair